MEFKSVNKILQESMIKNWDRPALTNYQGMTLAYREVALRIAKLHIAFEMCGLKKGDKVAICSRNQANWGVSLMAAITYGAVAVPILHEFKPGNIHYLVNHSEARVLFVDEVIWEGLSPEEMPDLSVVVQINNFKFLYAASQALTYVREHLNEEFGKRYPNSFGPEDLHYYEDSPEELAIINYTSGTSGFSKGVMIPYRAIYSNVEFAAKDACPMLKAGMNVVAMLPSAHMYGMMFEFLFEMTIGMHVHFLSRVPSPKIIMQAFSEVHPDIIIAVPLVMEKVYKSKLKPLVDKTKYYRRIPVLDKVIEKKFCTELTNAFGGQFEEVILGGAAFNPGRLQPGGGEVPARDWFPLHRRLRYDGVRPHHLLCPLGQGEGGKRRPRRPQYGNPHRFPGSPQHPRRGAGKGPQRVPGLLQKRRSHHRSLHGGRLVPHR